MDIRFTEPQLLHYAAVAALLLLLAVGISAVGVLKRRVRGRLSPLSSIIRIAAFLLIAAALADPFLEISRERSTTYLMVDISDSNEESVSQSLLASAGQLIPPDSDIRLIAFSGQAGEIEHLSSYPDSFSAIKSSHHDLNIGETNIENALRAAQAAQPGSILLVSDGYETAGDVLGWLSAETGKSKVFPIAPAGRSQQQNVLKISNLHAPLTAPSEKSVDVKTSIMNSSNTRQGGLLEVKHDGKVILSERVTLSPGKEDLFVAQSDPSREGIKEIVAVFTPDDSAYAPSSRRVFLSGEEREKIFVISGQKDDHRFLPSLLQAQAYQVDAVIAAEERPALDQLTRYSVIMLNNVPLRALPEGAAAKLESYVRSGGAVIMVGGDRSYGLGGYKNTPVEDLLPVDMVPPQTVEKRLNVAMQLVIDKSRSMSAGRRLDFAKEAAIEVINNLKNEDLVGVMGFDENPFVVIRMDKVAKIRSEAARRVSMLWPRGGTSLIGAMDEARRDLVRAAAGRKHMLVLSDGEVTDLPRTTYYEMVRQARLLGITISTVMLGNQGDDSMFREMANLGGGKFYATNDPRALPKIFVSDVKVASGEETIKEDSSYGVRIGPDLRSTDITSYPQLRGYVQTKPKSRARVELEVYGSQRKDPLLASWEYGKGKSIAFTSDINGRWSGSWIEWTKLQEFVTDLIDSLRPEETMQGQKIPFTLSYYFEKGRLHLDLALFALPDAGGVSAEILKPDGTKETVEFKSEARGRYLASVDNPLPGKYEVRAAAGTSPLTPVAFDLPGDLFGERKGQGLNLPFLEQLAGRSGGKVNPSADELKLHTYKQTERQDLGVYFIVAALALLLIEILYREVGFISSFRRLGSAVRGRAA
ncbi:MAG: VWA domain-containing protein [Deltaproteobacteria bacterium]|nr:VWA domain-containing protein [Deltaproteobacteria bacterium]